MDSEYCYVQSPSATHCDVRMRKPGSRPVLLQKTTIQVLARLGFMQVEH